MTSSHLVFNACAVLVVCSTYLHGCRTERKSDMGTDLGSGQCGRVFLSSTFTRLPLKKYPFQSVG
jgi:predicted small secreted protein